jgi:hypothetical protein
MREAGDFSIDIRDHDLEIELANLPPEMNSLGLKHSWVGTVRGLLSLADCEAAVDLALVDDGFTIDVDWS